DPAALRSTAGNRDKVARRGHLDWGGTSRARAVTDAAGQIRLPAERPIGEGDTASAVRTDADRLKERIQRDELRSRLTAREVSRALEQEGDAPTVGQARWRPRACSVLAGREGREALVRGCVRGYGRAVSDGID